MEEPEEEEEEEEEEYQEEAGKERPVLWLRGPLATKYQWRTSMPRETSRPLPWARCAVTSSGSASTAHAIQEVLVGEGSAFWWALFGMTLLRASATVRTNKQVRPNN
jgi:hypothetical protein